MTLHILTSGTDPQAGIGWTPLPVSKAWILKMVLSVKCVFDFVIETDDGNRVTTILVRYRRQEGDMFLRLDKTRWNNGILDVSDRNSI